MSRETLIDCMRREFQRQEQQRKPPLDIWPGEKPDTLYVEGFVDLLKLAEAIQEKR